MKVFLALVALALLASTVSAGTYYAQAMGRVLCRIGYNLYPIKEVTVRLMDKDTFRDDEFGSTVSDSYGYFYTQSGSVREFFGNPEPYIKVQYQYNGPYGQMQVNGLFKTIRDDRSRTKPYSGMIYFGDVVFSSDHCRAYVKFYNGLKDYYNRTGESFPINPLHIRTNAILNFGQPYARIDTISLPGRYPVTMTTAKVQLAHILRHSLDGGLAHLLRDVARFNYGGPHECSTVTNAGRAFDEGWGEYWAGGCTENDYNIYYYRDYSVIGNVAAGLRRIQMRCGFTYWQMIDVLRRNPGNIHSFQEYEQASNCPDYLYPSPEPATQRPSIPLFTEPVTPQRPNPFPFGVTGFEGEVQEDRNEELMSENKEMIQALLKLLENK